MSRRAKRRKRKLMELFQREVEQQEESRDVPPPTLPRREETKVTTYKVPEATTKIEIRFPWLEFRKIRALVEAMDTEVSGWCDAVVVDGRVQILRTAVPKQTVSSGHAIIDARQSVECAVLGELDIERAIVSWHSHNTMSAFVSGVDGPTFDRFAATMPIFVGLVTNKAGDWKAEVRVRTSVGLVVLEGKVTYEAQVDPPEVATFVELGKSRATTAAAAATDSKEGDYSEGWPEYPRAYSPGIGHGYAGVGMGFYKGKFSWSRPGITVYEKPSQFACDRAFCKSVESDFSIELDKQVGIITFCEDCHQDLLLWLTTKDKDFTEKITRKMLEEDIPDGSGLRQNIIISH